MKVRLMWAVSPVLTDEDCFIEENQDCNLISSQIRVLTEIQQPHVCDIHSPCQVLDSSSLTCDAFRRGRRWQIIVDVQDCLDLPPTFDVKLSTPFGQSLNVIIRQFQFSCEHSREWQWAHHEHRCCSRFSVWECGFYQSIGNVRGFFPLFSWSSSLNLFKLHSTGCKRVKWSVLNVKNKKHPSIEFFFMMFFTD